MTRRPRKDAAIDDLRDRRQRLHGLAGDEVIDTPERVAEYVERVGMALLSGRGSLPSLPSVIAGYEISGNWMSDLAAARIYEVLNRLDLCGVPQARFFEGKFTALSRRAAAALVRYALDPERMAEAKRLHPKANDVLWRVEERWVPEAELLAMGEATRKDIDALERSLLIFSRSLHTSRGRHEREITAWHHHPIARSSAASGTTALPAQFAALRPGADLLVVCFQVVVYARRRSVARWFYGASSLCEELIKYEILQPISKDEVALRAQWQLEV